MCDKGRSFLERASMKILFVTDQRYRSSGVSVFCIELCEALSDIGVNVRLALQRPDFKDSYPVRHEGFLTTIADILCNQDAFEWDVVHINGVWNWSYHKIARIAYRKGVPVVWSSHGSLNPWAFRHKYYKKWPAWVLYQKHDLRKANLLHVTAPSEKRHLKELGLVNDIVIQPLGTTFRWNDEQLDKIKGMSRDKRILFLGRLHPVKGIDNLIRAWAKIKSEVGAEGVVNWKVDIIGGDVFSGYGDELRKLCMKLGVENDFSFSEALYGDEKSMAYAGAKVFVLPSHSENFGSVIAEALANGTPVITTTGTPWRGVEEHKCGWWMDIGVEPLVCALKEVMHLDEGTLREMGKRGREWMKRDFSWGAIAKKMEMAYEWVCGKGTKPEWVESE